MSYIDDMYYDMFYEEDTFTQRRTDTEIVCPKCKYEKAVRIHWSSGGRPGFRDPSETRIKCPKCGYEEDIE